MSRRIRRDLNKRIGSSGYQQIAGDLEVRGRILGPSISNIATGLSAISASTTTPVQLPPPTATGGYRSIILRWDKQFNLLNLDHYNVAVAEVPAGPWYMPASDGINWGFVEGSVAVKVEMYIHAGIPPAGNVDAPVGRTLWYRIQQETTTGDLGAWSTPVSATTQVVETGNVAANAIRANNILATEIATFLLRATSAVIIGQDYGTDTPPLGAQRIVCDNNELRLDEWNGTTWDVIFRIGGDDQLKWYLQARGLIKPGADISGFEMGEKLPSGFKLWTFDNTYNDETATDIWEGKANTEFVADADFGRVYAVRTTNHASGIAYIYDSDTYLWSIGDSCAIDLKIKMPDDASVYMGVVWDNTTDYFSVGADKTTVTAKILKNSVSHSITLPVPAFDTILHISAGYDSSTDKLYLVVNGTATFSASAAGGSWANLGVPVGLFAITLGTTNPPMTNKIPMADLMAHKSAMLSTTLALSIAVAQTHYANGQKWVASTGIDYLLDLILLARGAGNIKLLSPTDYYAPVAGESSLGTSHPHVYTWADLGAVGIGTYTYTLPAAVPDGVTGVWVWLEQRNQGVNGKCSVQDTSGNQYASAIGTVLNTWATCACWVKVDASKQFQVVISSAAVFQCIVGMDYYWI